MSRARTLHPSVLVLLLLSAPFVRQAEAHEYWLAPSSYRSAPGDTITVRAFVGTGFRGEARPFARTRALRFSLEGVRPVDLRGAAGDGDSVWVHLANPDTGGAYVVYESNHASIELPAGEFESYLKLEGLEQIVGERIRRGEGAKPGRERYRRACKAWLAGRDTARASRPVGLPLEIVPLAEPTLPGPLRVRVLRGKEPLANALVRAWRQPFDAGGRLVAAALRDSVGPATEGRTDGAGEVELALTGAGEWLVSTVCMVRSTVPEEADWESTWASLTFARPAAPKPAP